MFEKRNQHCPLEESLNCKTYVNLLPGAIPWHFMQIKAVRACRCIQWDEYHWMAHRGPKVSLRSRVRASSGLLYSALISSPTALAVRLKTIWHSHEALDGALLMGATRPTETVVITILMIR